LPSCSIKKLQLAHRSQIDVDPVSILPRNHKLKGIRKALRFQQFERFHVEHAVNMAKV